MFSLNINLNFRVSHQLLIIERMCIGRNVFSNIIIELMQPNFGKVAYMCKDGFSMWMYDGMFRVSCNMLTMSITQCWKVPILSPCMSPPLAVGPSGWSIKKHNIFV